MNTLNQEVINYFQYIADFMSIPSCQTPYLIDDVLQGIHTLVDNYSLDEVIKTIKTIAKDDAMEFYWLARAGFQEVKPFLISRLSNKEETQVLYACMGLAYLNEEVGILKLKELAKKSLETDTELTLHDIYEELLTSDLQIFQELKNWSKKKLL